MTPEQKTTLQAYINRLKDLMALKDWTVEVTADECPGGANASFTSSINRKLSTLRVCAEFFTDRTPEEQRHTICHELVHGHTAAMWGLIEEDTQVFMGRDTHTFFKNTFMNTMEYAVDGIADGWAPFLPLPVFDEPDTIPKEQP